MDNNIIIMMKHNNFIIEITNTNDLSINNNVIYGYL